MKDKLKDDPTSLKVGDDSNDSENSVETSESIRVLDSRYQLIEMIGQGGMGCVYRARDLSTDGIVAVKLLNPDLTADSVALKRFERETEALRQLEHEQIVSLRHQGLTESGAPYLVMDLAQGQSLAQLLEKETALSPQRAIAIAKQIARAIGHAHARGFIHRDLKPSNIMVDTESGIDNVRILDFGIAGARECITGNTTNLTQTGAVFGTPTYMSPEQCEGKPVSERSDIYSFGCVLFEMLNGKPPFQGDSPVQVALKHIREPLPMPSFSTAKDLRNKSPRHLAAITQRCLDKNPLLRYKSFDDLLNDFQRLERSKGPVAYSVNKNSSRPPWIVYGLGFVGVPIYLLSIVSSIGVSFSDSITSSSLTPVSGGLMLINSYGTLMALFCILRDLKAFRAVNRNNEDFWNIVESGALFAAFACSNILWIFQVLDSTGKLSNSSLADLLALIWCLAFYLSAATGLLYKAKLLSLPFDTNIVKRQFLKVMAPAALILALSIAFPNQGAYPLLGLAANFTFQAPNFAQHLADLANRMNRDIAIYNLKKNIYIAQGKSDKMLEELNQAIEKNPKSVEALQNRAQSRAASNQKKEALADLDKALSLDKTNNKTYILRASLYSELGRFEEAIRDCDTAIAMQPYNPQIRRIRAMNYAALKRYDLAVKDQSLVVASHDPQDSEPRYDQLRLAVYHHLNGNHRLAANCSRKVLEGGDADDIAAYANKLLGNGAKYLEYVQKQGYYENHDTKKEVEAKLFTGRIKLPMAF